MALQLDPSTPSLGAGSNDPWLSPVFEPVDDSLIIAIAMGDWFTSTPTLTFSGGSLVYTQRTKRGALNAGVVEIRTAEVGIAPLMSVSVSTSISSDVGGIKPYVVTGHDPTNYVNAVAGGDAVDLNNLNASITTTVDNCMIFGGMVDWDSNGVPSSSDVGEGFDDADLSIMAVRKAAAVGAAGTYTLNFNASGSASCVGSWAAIAIAPLAGGGGGGNPGVIYLEDGTRLLLEDGFAALKES